MRSVDRVELAALCTSRPESARAAADAYGVARAYHDVAEMAALQGRHDPALTHIKELVDTGWLGQVLSVKVSLLGSGALTHHSSDAWMGNGATAPTP